MKKGFTLMEMLVVVAILVILAALLFPVLRKAIEAGQKVGCMSRLRQIGLASRLYADDYDGRYPLGAVATTAGWSLSWHDLLQPPLSPHEFFCPLAPRGATYRTSYGVNHRVSGYGVAAGQWEADGSRWYVTEKNNGDWAAYLPEERHAPYWKPLDPRHGGKLFYLRLDGSVKLEKDAEVGR